jgi:hypothetical protein
VGNTTPILQEMQMAEKTYIALANIRGKKNYDRGNEISESEYKNLSKYLKNKFRESGALSMAMLEGDETRLKGTIQQLWLKNEALEKEIKVLKGEKVEGKAITTETGGKEAPKKL